jgi:hypothetical protein
VYLDWAVPSAARAKLLARFAHSQSEHSCPDALGLVFLVPADLNLASTSSTLVAARPAPMAHDVFDDFKKLLMGGWEE